MGGEVVDYNNEKNDEHAVVHKDEEFTEPQEAKSLPQCCHAAQSDVPHEDESGSREPVSMIKCVDYLGVKRHLQRLRGTQRLPPCRVSTFQKTTLGTMCIVRYEVFSLESKSVHSKRVL